MTNTIAPTRPKVLTSAEIEQFVDQGYVLLRRAFSPEAAAAVRSRVWEGLGLSPGDPAGWTDFYRRLEAQLHGSDVDECLSERFTGAVDDLLGEGKWRPLGALGGWPVSFPGFAKGAWTPPAHGWHIDGSQFHHHLTSPDQGLLPIFLFSDIGSGDGGTAIRPGSHKVTARILAESEPEGLDAHALAIRTNAEPYDEVIEATGDAGDVLLLHPFMSHAASLNTGTRVRFICNPCVALKEPIDPARDNAARFTPLERSIANALRS